MRNGTNTKRNRKSKLSKGSKGKRRRKKEQGDTEAKEELHKKREIKPKISVDTSLPNGICRIFNSLGKRTNGERQEN
jgi:hypothetical protein